MPILQRVISIKSLEALSNLIFQVLLKCQLALISSVIHYCM